MSSRATEITLFLVILQAAIGFVNATDLFSNDYYATPQNQYVYNVSDLEDYTAITNDRSPLDYFTMLVSWTWHSFIIVLQIVFSIVFIFAPLVNTFGVPIILAAFIQVGIYFIYATWYIQFKSGKGFKQYD